MSTKPIKNPILNMINIADNILKNEVVNIDNINLIRSLLQDIRELYYFDYDIARLSKVVHIHTNIPEETRNDFCLRLRKKLYNRDEMFSNFKIKAVEISP